MKYEIKIKRTSDSDSFYQSFYFEGNGNETIAAVLDKLNSDDLFDVTGKPAKKIMWSHSCDQGICGACSMVINGVPALACKTKLNSLKGTLVKLEPLKKFPVISDLSSDRTALYEAPILHGLWNESKAKQDNKDFNLQYAASKCMRCGICVEVCPDTDILSKNLGAVFAVNCYLVYKKSDEKDEKKKIKKEYVKGFASDCSKSMACAAHCPAKIDIKKLINYMNKW